MSESGFVCTNCNRVFGPGEDAEMEPCYECENCNEIFLRSDSYDGCSHRCPSCGKFSSKLHDLSCPDCVDTEVEPAQVVENDEDEWVLATKCPACKGSGKIGRIVEAGVDDLGRSVEGVTYDTCPNCGGDGEVPEEKPVKGADSPATKKVKEWLDERAARRAARACTTPGTQGYEYKADDGEEKK
jgi:hypothetical protein